MFVRREKFRLMRSFFRSASFSPGKVFGSQGMYRRSIGGSFVISGPAAARLSPRPVVRRVIGRPIIA
jgi:hypothetical protein